MSTSEYITETVLILFLYQSTKAIKIILNDGRTMWIPKSIIRNLEQLEISNFEDYQYIEIDRWFVEKYQLPIEL